MPFTPADTLFNKYRVEKYIDRGSFGEVYCVTRLRVRRAIKLMRRDAPGVGSTDCRKAAERFQFEAELGARLNHPNIIRVYDLEDQDDMLGLVMEYAPGGSLADKLKDGRSLTLPGVVRLGLEACQGLGAIHKLGAVHRDIKPANLLYGEDGTVKIGDLGLAQVVDDTSRRSLLGSLAGAHPGTPLYMSPEQENTQGHLLPGSDIFSLGCVLFEALTGRPYKNHYGERAAGLRESTPAWLDVLIARMLCEQPARTAADDLDEQKRYRSAEQVRKALEEGWQTAKLAIAAARQKKVVEEDEKQRLQAENDGLRAELGQERAARLQAEEALGTAQRQIGNLETDLKAQAVALEAAQSEKQALAAQKEDELEFLHVQLQHEKEAAQSEKQTLAAQKADEIEFLQVQLQQEKEARQNDKQALAQKADEIEFMHVQIQQQKETRRNEKKGIAQRIKQFLAQKADEIEFLNVQLQQEKEARQNEKQALAQKADEIEFLNVQLQQEKEVRQNDKQTLAQKTAELQKERADRQQKAAALQAAEGKNQELLAQIAKLPGAQAGRSEKQNRKSIFARFWPLGYALAGFMLVFLLLRPGASPAPSLASTAGVSPSSTPLPLATSTSMSSPTPGPTATPLPSPAPTLGIGSTWLRSADNMTMLYVPGGTFTMGSADMTDATPHQVTLSAYWIDQTDVTNAEYAKCVAAGGCAAPSSISSATRARYYSNSQFDNYPVIEVTWDQAKSYCAWAGKASNATVGLPTEAQWELAARGTDGRIYPWGSAAIDKSYANYNQNVGDTTAVCSYPQGNSPYGACDIAGNVWQWVADLYGAYGTSPVSNPGGPPSGTSRVLRGGSWSYYVNGLRSAFRYSNDPAFTVNYIGFRCARSQ